MAVRSAREAAYETIRSRIITMELKPGDELNDHELAQELGSSRTPMREALIMLNIAHMVTIKPQSGTYVAPIDLELMEMEQFARFTLEKELLNHIRGRLTGEQERAYRLLIEQYRVLESHPEAANRETRMLDLDNAFHRRAFELCGMEDTLTTCFPPFSTSSGCVSSACRRMRTNRSVVPTPASWRLCSTARKRM